MAVTGNAADDAASRGDRDILATAKGSGFLAGGTVFEFATRFVIAFVLARYLGAEGYGLYVLALSAATIFAGLSQVGLDDAMVRYVAIMSGRRDPAGLWGTLQIGFGISMLSSLVMAAVLLLAAQPIAEGIFHEPRLTELLSVIAFIVPFLAFSNVLDGVLYGFRRMDSVALAENVIQTLVRVALLLVVALLGHLDVLAAVVIFGISDVAASVAMVAILHRQFPLNRRIGSEVRRDVRDVFGFALPLWISGMLRQFRRNVESVLVGVYAAASSVGVIAIAHKANLVGHISLLSILVAVKPTLARLHDQGDKDGMARLYTAATRWTLMLNVPFFLVLVLYAKPILSVFGETFATGAAALTILAFAELVNAGTGICGPVIDMTGHTRVKVANSVLWTVLVVAGNALLVPRWGVIGAATAASVAIVAVNLLTVGEVWLLERLSPFDRRYLKPVGAGLGALAVGLALRSWMPVGTDPAAAAFQGVLVGLSYLALVWVLGLAPEDRMIVDRVVSTTRSRLTRLLRRNAGARARQHGTTIRVPRGAAAVDHPDPGPPAARGPIFIGGLDRSGKTTMQAFLSSHPDIAIPDVGSNMWTYFYDRFGDLAQADNLERCMGAMLRYTHVAVLDPDPARIRREFSQGPATYARLFALFLMHFAERQGKPRWGAQTGLIERYTEQLFDAYPGVKVIHMVRDPRDRYEASLQRSPGGRGRAGGATARWRYSVALARRGLARHPDDYLLVRYEDLVQRTEETLRTVCEFLGETFQPDMLTMPGAPERRARLMNGRRPAGSSLLTDEYIGRYRGRVPANELTFIQLHAGRWMRAHGYAPEPTALSGRDWARFAALDWPNQAARMVAWRGVEALQQRFPAQVGRKPDPRQTCTPTGSG